MATKKRRATGIMQTVHPDEALASIVGNRPMPRPMLMKRVWDYIKSHRLQDRRDGRVIHPDRALGRVVGNKRNVSMFEIPRSLNAHLRP